MPNAIAFFPWLSCRQALHVGPARLLPFLKGKSPGDLPSMTQADMDGVLKAYSRHPGTRSKEATILEVADWQTGMDVPRDTLEQLFEARQYIAFGALSKRRLFRGHSGYTNSDTYELVVQRFRPGDPGTFSFTTRRRDGSTSHLWGSDDFAFHRPQHVELRAVVDIDEPLVCALFSLPPDLAHFREAIVEFIAANTDALGIPEHVEMVMTKSAFERVLGVDHDARRFQIALAAALHSIPEVPPKGPQQVDWSKKWRNARPLDAWARDFCAVRGMAAHGIRRDAEPSSVWTATHHLAFSSMLFPLLVKKLLSDHGLMTLDAFDVERIKRLQWYLTADPFAATDDSDEEAEHPWLAVDSLARIHAVAPSFYASMAGTPHRGENPNGH